jgi:hypothetical protein
MNTLGEVVEQVHQGWFPAGTSKYFLHANHQAAGAYIIALRGEDGTVWTQHLMIH